MWKGADSTGVVLAITCNVGVEGHFLCGMAGYGGEQTSYIAPSYALSSDHIQLRIRVRLIPVIPDISLARV